MRDFRTALAVARETHAKMSGNTGNSGNRQALERENGSIEPVATSDDALATVATSDHAVNERGDYDDMQKMVDAILASPLAGGVHG